MVDEFAISGLLVECEEGARAVLLSQRQEKREDERVFCFPFEVARISFTESRGRELLPLCVNLMLLGFWLFRLPQFLQ